MRSCKLKIYEAKTIAKHTIAILKKMRTEKKGYLFWEDVKQTATKWDVHAPTGKGKKSTNKNKRIFRWKSSTWICHYRRVYCECLVCIINAVEELFDQKDFRTYVKLENLLLKAAKDALFIQEYMMLWQYTAATSIKIDFEYS